MTKLVNKISAVEARAKANNVKYLLQRIYDNIKYAAENNSYYIWYWLDDAKPELVLEAVKELKLDGYKIELFEEKEECCEDACCCEEPKYHPEGLEVIDYLVGLINKPVKIEKEKEDKEDDKEKEIVYREIRISWE